MGRRGRRVLPGLGRGHQTGIMGGSQMLGRTVRLPGPAGSGLPGRGRRGGGAGPDGAEFGRRETQASHGFLGAETGESGHPTRVCLDWTARCLGRCREVGGRESPEQTRRDAPFPLPAPAPPNKRGGQHCGILQEGVNGHAQTQKSGHGHRKLLLKTKSETANKSTATDEPVPLQKESQKLKKTATQHSKPN